MYSSFQTFVWQTNTNKKLAKTYTVLTSKKNKTNFQTRVWNRLPLSAPPKTQKLKLRFWKLCAQNTQHKKQTNRRQNRVSFVSLLLFKKNCPFRTSPFSSRCFSLLFSLNSGWEIPFFSPSIVFSHSIPNALRSNVLQILLFVSPSA